MKSALFALAILFVLVVLASPLRFAYAQIPPPQNPFSAAQSAIQNFTGALQAALVPPPLVQPPLLTELQTGAPHNDAPTAQLASAVASAAGGVAQSVFGGAKVAGQHVSYMFAQTAVLWSAWVSLANSDLVSHVKVTTVPSTAAVTVSQTGANAPPVLTSTLSALPTPHLFPIAGASSRQS